MSCVESEMLRGDKDEGVAATTTTGNEPALRACEEETDRRVIQMASHPFLLDVHCWTKLPDWADWTSAIQIHGLYSDACVCPDTRLSTQNVIS